MQKFGKVSIPDLLVQNIDRDLILAIEESLMVGALRAYECSKNMQFGHRPSVLGQMRHFHMNETFHRALEAKNASPTAIRGNEIVTGHSGIFTLARVNTSVNWRNISRSKKRQAMSFKNINIQMLVQPELFAMFQPASEGFVLFLTEFHRSVCNSPEIPVSIKIIVPSSDMKTCLFEEHLSVFLRRYEKQPMQQIDKAKPRLKKNRKTGNDGMEK